jgi:DNA replication and repair protein RecF
MRLLRLHTQQYRNLSAVQMAPGGQDAFFVGKNAQGKTNLLEAIGLLSTLRAFRTQTTAPLIQHGHEEAGLFFMLEKHGHEHTVELQLKPAAKRVLLDADPVARLADYAGLFPTVTLASEDIQLIRGGPALRRRFLDMTLAAADPVYWQALTDLNQCLRGRARLLKQRAKDAELAAFEAPLARAASQITRLRLAALDPITKALRAAYLSLSDCQDSPHLGYTHHPSQLDTQSAAEHLERQREGDRRLGTTRTGPHRDDLLLALGEHPARAFASEGQQRSLAISLRLAQAAYLQARTGTSPLVLADDILGELDADRRAGFWKALDPDAQVIATGTQLPVESPRQWRIWTLQGGTPTEQGTTAPSTQQEKARTP